MQRRGFLMATGAGLITASRSPFPVGRPSRGGPDLTAILEPLRAKHGVPGALVGVWVDGAAQVAAAGIANLNTGVPMTPDTAFLTGSITKVWTTTVVMTLVDQGKLDLDRPVRSYLPHFRVLDTKASEAITVRQLLNHSSGIDAGDYLLELGDGPAAHRQYVDLLAQVGQIHAPGAYSSYCNGGFILAGHLAEFVTGDSFDRLIRERIVKPLHLDRTVTDPSEALMHRLAVGSVPDGSRPGGHRAAARFSLPRSAAPAGSTLITTIEDQLAFAAMHLNRGVGPSRSSVLSTASATAMATRTIGRPTGAGGYGLGWGVTGRPGDTRLSHSGGSNGGIAQLVLFPERRIAFASFANSSSSYGFHAELQQAVLAAAGVAPAPRPAATAPAAPVGPPLDPARVIGAYRRKSERTTIEADGPRFMADVATFAEEFHGSESYNDGQARRFEVVASGPSQLTSRDPVLLGQKMVYDFLEPRADGRFDLIYGAGRLARRADPA